MGRAARAHPRLDLPAAWAVEHDRLGTIGEHGFHHNDGRFHRCSPRDVRLVQYGLLGPDATSVTYRQNGHDLTKPVGSPDGTYLLVNRATPAACRTIRSYGVCGHPSSRMAGGFRSACPQAGMNRDPSGTHTAKTDTHRADRPNNCNAQQSKDPLVPGATNAAPTTGEGVAADNGTRL